MYSPDAQGTAIPKHRYSFMIRLPTLLLNPLFLVIFLCYTKYCIEDNMATINNELLRLAKKYFARNDLTIDTIADLKKLSPQQLNRLTNWATNTNPDIKARIQGNKYSGKTYGKLKQIF